MTRLDEADLLLASHDSAGHRRDRQHTTPLDGTSLDVLRLGRVQFGKTAQGFFLMKPAPTDKFTPCTWTEWLCHNVSVNASQWRQQDRGQWQRTIHDQMRAGGETPWIDKAISTARDSYGIKGT